MAETKQCLSGAKMNLNIKAIKLIRDDRLNNRDNWLNKSAAAANDTSISPVAPPWPNW